MGKWSDMISQALDQDTPEGEKGRKGGKPLERAYSPYSPLRTLVPEGVAALPGDWQSGYAQLIQMDKPAIVSTQWWGNVQRNCFEFMQSDWALRAQDLGWSTNALFGCHRESPEHRFDAMGLVVALKGKRLVALSEKSARLEPVSGRGTLIHWRGLTCGECEAVPVWGLGRSVNYDD